MKLFDPKDRAEFLDQWRRRKGEPSWSREFIQRRAALLRRMVQEGYVMRRSALSGHCKGATGAFGEVISHYQTGGGDAGSTFRRGVLAGEEFEIEGEGRERWLALTGAFWRGDALRPDSYRAIYVRIG